MSEPASIDVAAIPRHINLTGRRVCAFVLPAEFFIQWMQAGGALGQVMLPPDAVLVSVVPKPFLYPDEMLLLVESIEYAVLDGPFLPAARLNFKRDADLKKKKARTPKPS